MRQFSHPVADTFPRDGVLDDGPGIDEVHDAMSGRIPVFDDDAPGRVGVFDDDAPGRVWSA